MATHVNIDGLFLDRHYAGIGINRYLPNPLREHGANGARQSKCLHHICMGVMHA